ncbi:MAG: hypothetical protein MUF36_06400 [Bacteroidales bacterium]|nr:hypothetical protein [Bacteroidales bacterium]
MKNFLIVTILLIFISSQVPGQQSLDTLYLKNGSIIYGTIKGNTENQYNIQTVDGRQFIFSNEEVDRFVSRAFPGKHEPEKSVDILYLKNGSVVYGKLIEKSKERFLIKTADGFRFIFTPDQVEKQVEPPGPEGLGITLQAGVLIAFSEKSYCDNILMHNDPHILFSITPMITYTFFNIHSLSVGTGLEFYNVLMAPLFMEYKINFFKRRSTPFFYARGGGLISVYPQNGAEGNQDFDPILTSGWSYGSGFGLSLPAGRREFHIQAGYRYAYTSYANVVFNAGYKRHVYAYKYNIIDLTLGFKF